MLRTIVTLPCILSLSALSFAAPPVATDPAATLPPHTVRDGFQDAVRHITPAQPWKATTVEEHAAWKERFQQTVVKLLGDMPARTTADVQWTEKVEFEKFTRHKIYVRTQAEYWAPVYYFVPVGVTQPRPAIVCLHGHSGIDPYIREGKNESERHHTEEAALDYAVYMAEHGYVTAAIVVRGWNETADWQDGGIRIPRSCTQVTMSTLLTGMTPQGLRCWDAMRIIDFLETQAEVDSERIGVAGLSGGGTLAMYLPILEPRVKLTMIAGAFSSYRASIYTVRHCICNCLPGIMLEGEMADVVALHAPRPVLLINGVKDPIFPIAEAREGFAQLQNVYALLGVPDAVDNDFFDGPHAWSNNKTLSFLKSHFGDLE